MKFAVTALVFLGAAGAALAEGPVKLTEEQMDGITAGSIGEASARLQALQVQQQLGIQGVSRIQHVDPISDDGDFQTSSIANQAPQSVLSLFR